MMLFLHEGLRFRLALSDPSIFLTQTKFREGQDA
jgi:hypothetical protein